MAERIRRIEHGWEERGFGLEQTEIGIDAPKDGSLYTQIQKLWIPGLYIASVTQNIALRVEEIGKPEKRFCGDYVGGTIIQFIKDGRVVALMGVISHKDALSLHPNDKDLWDKYLATQKAKVFWENLGIDLDQGGITPDGLETQYLKAKVGQDQWKALLSYVDCLPLLNSGGYLPTQYLQELARKGKNQALSNPNRAVDAFGKNGFDNEIRRIPNRYFRWQNEVFEELNLHLAEVEEKHELVLPKYFFSDIEGLYIFGATLTSDNPEGFVVYFRSRADLTSSIRTRTSDNSHDNLTILSANNNFHLDALSGGKPNYDYKVNRAFLAGGRACPNPSDPWTTFLPDHFIGTFDFGITPWTNELYIQGASDGLLLQPASLWDIHPSIGGVNIHTIQTRGLESTIDGLNKHDIYWPSPGSISRYLKGVGHLSPRDYQYYLELRKKLNLQRADDFSSFNLSLAGSF